MLTQTKIATERDREDLKNINPSRKWASKVNRMTDAQVLAIIHRLHLQGKM